MKATTSAKRTKVVVQPAKNGVALRSSVASPFIPGQEGGSESDEQEDRG
jgi:hypothetical protein